MRYTKSIPSCLSLVLALASPAGADGPGYLFEELGDGIYLSRPADPFAGPVDGNAVVLVNDRDVVLVDTHINPAATRELVTRIREVTDKPVSLVLNTHWHDDHVNGNATIRDAWPGAVFVAHEVTLDSLRSTWETFEEGRLTNYRRVADLDLEAEAAKLEASEPHMATTYRLYGQYRDALLPELPDLELVYPDSTFSELIRLERGPRTIEIRHLGVGNTAGDAVVWLPEERVLITGDMVVHPVPYAFGVDFEPWISTLDRVRALEPLLLIPGHGPVLHDTDYVARLQELLRSLIAAVEDARERGFTLEEATAEILLEEQAADFAGEDPAARYAFESYFRRPAIESAWSIR